MIFNKKLEKGFWQVYSYTKFKPQVFADSSCKRSLHYRLFSPKGESNKQYPLILYLHGGGHKGNDNTKQILSALAYTWIKWDLQKKHPCYILAPQCPPEVEWVTIRPKSIPFGHYSQDNFPEGDEMKLIIKLINNLILNKTIDPKRIYVAGYSMGGTGTWDIMTRHPDLFCAALIASGETDTTKAYLLKNIPIQAFCAENDSIVTPKITQEMVDAVNLKGGKAKFTLFKGTGHDSIGRLAFDYPGIKDWLFSQRKN